MAVVGDQMGYGLGRHCLGLYLILGYFTRFSWLATLVLSSRNYLAHSELGIFFFCCITLYRSNLSRRQPRISYPFFVSYHFQMLNCISISNLVFWWANSKGSFHLTLRLSCWIAHIIAQKTMQTLFPFFPETSRCILQALFRHLSECLGVENNSGHTT